MKEYVSIIIPTYNRMDKLKKSVNSVLEQTYSYFEIIIIDDASTDQTEAMVKSFSDTRIRYIKNKKNLGPAAARNIGIENAKYEYIAFNDSDDSWLNDKLEKQMDKMHSNEAFGMVYCAYYLGNENKKVKVPSDMFSKKDLEGDIFQSLWRANKIGTPTILVKKQCIEYIGKFNEDLHSIEDWEFVLRIASRYQIGYVNEVLVNATKSYTGVDSNKKAQVSTYYFLIQHYGRTGLDISSKINRMMSAMVCLDDEDVTYWKSKMIPKYFKDVKEFEQHLESAKERHRLVTINRLLVEISNTKKLFTFLESYMNLRTDAIAVYGAGMVGEFLAKKLTEIGVNVYCIFDKNDILIENFRVKKPYRCNDDITKMIIAIGQNINNSEFQEWAGSSIEIINIYDILDETSI